MAQQIDREKLKRKALYPELRLVGYREDGSPDVAVVVSGDFLPIEAIEKGGKILEDMLSPLIKLLQAHISLRMEGGRWILPENHNNHPSIPIAKQLLNAAECGKQGYRVMLADDQKIAGRRYLWFQIDKASVDPTRS